MLESGLAAGLAAAGADVFLGGVLPTPGGGDPRPQARARPRGGRLGLPQPLGRQRDQVLRRERAQARRRGGGAGRGAGRRRPGAAPLRAAGSASSREPATTTCASSDSAFDLDLSGRKIVLDCANGATYRVAPAAFERLGAEVDRDRRRARRPQHQRGLRLDPPRDASAGRVARARARRSASPSTATATGSSPWTATARAFDGDEIVALAALHLQAAGQLPGGVAVTVMTNYGFHRAMADAGIEVATTKVGDRYRDRELLASADGRSAASSPVTSSGPTSRRRATGSRRRCC